MHRRRQYSTLRRRIVASATTAVVAGALGTASIVVTADTAAAQPGPNDGCSTRSGCYQGPGMRWCPGDYVWPGLVATGWDLSLCHVYHEQCPPGEVACPDFIAAGPPPPTPPPIIGDYQDCLRKLGPLSWLCPKG